MNAHITLMAPLELMKHRCSDVPYTIIDARPYADYAAGHIPGAIWMGWEQWCEKAPAHARQTLARPGYWGVLKEETDGSLQESLRRMGLSDERPVVVYADGPVSKGREGRIAWMLLYWGISPVLLLDGGWSAWLAQGGSSDETMPTMSTPSSNQLRICIQAQRRVQLSQLKQYFQHNSMPLLIDVRSRDEFRGHCHTYQPRLGRIPGAVHLPYTALFDEAGYFVTKSTYLRELPPRLRNADRCVACCEVGVRSALFALLHEVYTGQVVANFDGSIMEWALDSSLPMEYESRN